MNILLTEDKAINGILCLNTHPIIIGIDRHLRDSFDALTDIRADAWSTIEECVKTIKRSKTWKVMKLDPRIYIQLENARKEYNDVNILIHTLNNINHGCYPKFESND